MLRPVEELVLPIAGHRTGVAADAVQAFVFGDLGRVQRRLFHHVAVVLRALAGAVMMMLLVLLPGMLVLAGLLLDFRRDDHRSSRVSVIPRRDRDCRLAGERRTFPRTLQRLTSAIVARLIRVPRWRLLFRRQHIRQHRLRSTVHLRRGRKKEGEPILAPETRNKQYRRGNARNTDTTRRNRCASNLSRALLPVRSLPLSRRHSLSLSLSLGYPLRLVSSRAGKRSRLNYQLELITPSAVS